MVGLSIVAMVAITVPDVVRPGVTRDFDKNSSIAVVSVATIGLRF